MKIPGGNNVFPKLEQVNKIRKVSARAGSSSCALRVRNKLATKSFAQRGGGDVRKREKISEKLRDINT